MHAMRGVQDATEQRWNHVLHKLWLQIDRLTDHYMSVGESLLPYAEGTPARHDARARARRAYEYMVHKLLGLAMPDEVANAPQNVASFWARSDLPIDVLLQLTHLSNKVLWDALLWNTSKQDLPMLAVNAHKIWMVVHSYAAELQGAYFEEVTSLARERKDKQRDYAVRLVSTDTPSPQMVANTAAVLGLPVDSDFGIAVAPLTERESIRAAQSRLREGGVRALQFELGEHLVLLAPVDADGLAMLRALLAEVQCAIAPIARGLAAVPQRFRLAIQLVEVAADESAPHELAEVWDRLVGDSINQWGQDLRREVLGDLATRSDYEAQRLIETVTEFARRGSVTATAAALYCHRNTVINRLRTFRELTGHDMTVPRQAAAVIVSLGCAGE